MYTKLASIFRVPAVAWDRDGSESVNYPSICGRKFSCIDSRKFGNGMAIMGRFRNLHVSIEAQQLQERRH